MRSFTKKIMKIYTFIHGNESVQFLILPVSQSKIVQPVKLNY